MTQFCPRLQYCSSTALQSCACPPDGKSCISSVSYMVSYMVSCMVSHKRYIARKKTATRPAGPLPPAAAAGARTAGVREQRLCHTCTLAAHNRGRCDTREAQHCRRHTNVAHHACLCAIAEPGARNVGFPSRRGDMRSFN